MNVVKIFDKGVYGEMRSYHLRTTHEHTHTHCSASSFFAHDLYRFRCSEY